MVGVAIPGRVWPYCGPVKVGLPAPVLGSLALTGSPHPDLTRTRPGI